MHHILKQITESALRGMARVLLRKYHPLVVGVTGSVGKSSTKEAIVLVLSQKYSVRGAEGNYNNEIGIPLTILGSKSGEHSFFRWVWIGIHWLGYVLFPLRYPEVLVLEMGIDRPGDMEYLLSIVPIDIGVFTQVSESHIEFFGSLHNIAKEKGKLITSLPVSGFAILNADDARVVCFREKTKAKVLTFGFGEHSDVCAAHIVVEPEARLAKGLAFKMNYHGKSLPVRLPKVIARHQIAAALAAAAVGIALRVNPVQIVDALTSFGPLPGRMRLIPGVKGSILLDDTYNASPASTTAALAVLGELRANRKIAVLGDMLEIGEESVKRHRELSQSVLLSGVQAIILVGQRMKCLFNELIAQGFSRQQISWFERSGEAALFVESLAQEGDLVLVKGSRGMRMEWVSEKLLFDPIEAPHFLCCQSPEWKKKPFVPPAEWDNSF
ncbi:MAG: UDP-N-acetylmuramoyl-tripeptide--D-alanyl-D-alanine ligase [Candidatus Moranbacteria bacterium]|nr:UDP-N-acetylmuramoyl-tripeptide--D-alanyl-D-alanine ligase [Candidatus Moranbacteria bacterium]MBP9801229.1 UDP-N-acetylmuramoyl-tripeptide--D-alanyl-D-alanine ligase [Candidatus Moranbacteria bacterium]